MSLVRCELSAQLGHSGADMVGAGGFALLLATCLSRIADPSRLTSNQREALEAAGMLGDQEWQRGASKRLNTLGQMQF